MKCHQINDKTERNHEKQTFQDLKKKFHYDNGMTALSSRWEVVDTTENSRSGFF